MPHPSTLPRVLTATLLPLLSLGALLLTPSAAEATPSHCGNLNQRHCNIWEWWLPCDDGLAANYLTFSCQHAVPLFSPPPPSCGSLDQRPCFFWERMPSCDVGLVEDIILKQCVPTPQSAQPDPALDCGEQGERPCTFLDSPLTSSCRAGLKESFANPNLCVPLGPGEWSPFFAGLEGLNAQFQNLGSFARDQCRAWSKGQVDNSTPSPFAAQLSQTLSLSAVPVSVDPKCLQYAAAGFICETPTLIEMFDLGVDHTFFTNLQARFNDEYSSAECEGQPDIATRTGCAAGKMVFDDVLPKQGDIQDMQCFAAAVQRADMWQALLPAGVNLGPNQCMDIGVALFDLAMLAIESRGSFGKGGANKAGAAGWFANRRAKYANSPVGARLEQGSKTGFMRARDTVTAALDVLGTAEQVAAILESIPECAVPFELDAVAAGATFYRVDADGDLRMSQHDATGMFTAIDQEIGWGWAGSHSIFAVEGHYVYRIDSTGTLQIYQHDGTGQWQSATDIGWGWGGFTHVFAARFGQIYAIDGAGNLRYYEHDGNYSWSANSGLVIGNGWDPAGKTFSGGHGAIYTITDDGDLLYYYHDANFGWVQSALLLGTGWGEFATVGSTGNGELYAVTTAGEILFYRHDSHHVWLTGSGGMIGWGWPSFGPYGLIAAAY